MWVYTTHPANGHERPDPRVIDNGRMPEAPSSTPPRRIRLVGISGSGKTRLAAAIASRLRVAHLELDAVFWEADWTYRDLDEARRIVREFADAHPEGWVVEGNWNTRMSGLLAPGAAGGADVIVWLDHRRSLVMLRVVRRTLRRAIRHERLWHGNRERPSTWLRWNPDRNILRWTWVQHPVVRERMLMQMSDGMPVVRLQGKRAVDAWLATLTA